MKLALLLLALSSSAIAQTPTPTPAPPAAPSQPAPTQPTPTPQPAPSAQPAAPPQPATAPPPPPKPAIRPGAAAVAPPAGGATAEKPENHNGPAFKNPKSTLPKVAGIPHVLYSLKYVDIKVGTGPLAEPHKFFTVNYTGWFTDGTKFDSSYDHTPKEPITFPYGAQRVIIGWDTGFEGMRVGGKRRLYVPYQLAYGILGRAPKMGPKANLIFDVELISQSDKPPANMMPPGRPGGLPGRPPMPAPGAPGAQPHPPSAPATPSPAPSAPATPPPPATPAPATPPPATPPPAAKPATPPSK
jgi:peptidylprolyl isomerase